MHPCLALLLFLTVLQAATIQKLDERADLCDPTVRDCSDLPTTYDTSNPDLPPSFGLTLAAAPNLPLTLNNDNDPGIQPLNGNGAPSPNEYKDPSANENTEVPQNFDAAINFGQGSGDVAIVPQGVSNGVPAAVISGKSWDPAYGTISGFCHMYGTGCQLCYERFRAPTQCREAVLSEALVDSPGEYHLCLKDTTTLPPTCIVHSTANDDTPESPAPSDMEMGEWGYCNQRNLCAMCWKHASGQSTGCAPAVQKTLTSTSLPDPAIWLCFQYTKPDIHSCIQPDRWHYIG